MQQGQSNSKQEVISSEGRSLSEALDNINAKLGRRIDYGHCGAVVFGEKKCEEGLISEVKYLLSSSKVTPEVNLLIAEDKEAEEYLGEVNRLIEDATTSLNNFLKFNAEHAEMPSKNIITFLSELCGKSEASFIPLISMREQAPPVIPAVGTESGGGGGSENTPMVIDSINRVYAFNSKGAAGKLDKDSAKGLTWLDKDTNKGLLMAEDVEIDGHIIKYLPCRLRRKTYSKKAGFDSSGAYISYSFTVYFHCEDMHELNEALKIEEDFSRQKLNEAVKKSIETGIRKDLNSTVEKLRELDSDAMQIKTELNRFNKKKLDKFIEENPDFLSNVDVRYSFKIRVY